MELEEFSLAGVLDDAAYRNRRNSCTTPGLFVYLFVSQLVSGQNIHAHMNLQARLAVEYLSLRRMHLAP